MKEKIRKWNRTVLELECGILFWGLLCQAVGVWFSKDPRAYCIGLWIGIALGAFAGWHMYFALDRALSDSAANVSGRMTTANVLRYAFILGVFVLVILTKIGNPILTFVGIMGLKAGAYLQPLTHKLTNKYFREEDPAAQSMEKMNDNQKV